MNHPNESIPIDIAIKMKCRDCGHEQIVKGSRIYGNTYFGSAYDFCNKCDGLPVFVEKVDYPKFDK